MKNKPYYVTSEYQQDFSLDITRFNIQRGKKFAIIIILVELILLIIELFSRSVSTVFRFDWYAIMYILMIVVTGCLWPLFSRFGRSLGQTSPNIKAINFTITTYVTFLIVWGAAISLQDQLLYGNIVAFLVNMLLGSLIFYLKPKHIIIPQFIGSCVLLIGLPYFQPSLNILIGHYINVIIFILFSGLIARTNYDHYIETFMSHKLIEEKSNQLTRINDNLRLEIQSREHAQRELEQANEQLRAVSSLDALTGIPNRRMLEESLKEYWSRVINEQLPISVMMIDIDFFKIYNDTNGHLAGDHCLQEVAKVIHKCRREGKDFAARFGGEEFIFIATGMNLEDTLALGEKIRADIEALHMDHPFSSASPYVTASVGINWLLPTDADVIREAIDRADQAMYQAKETGRNRVVLAQPGSYKGQAQNTHV